MGFSKSSGKSSSSQQSGFALLPPEIQATYKQYASQLGNQFGSNNSALFTPQPISSAEQGALDRMSAGFGPTADSVRSDIQLQMNPYDEFVIQAINRAANDEGSQLRGALARAGQFGSSRDLVTNNDIDLTRLQKIGEFKQNQFNSALNNALTTLPNARRTDAQGALDAGGFTRNLDLQTRQAPISALQSFGALLGVLPSNGGSTGTSKSSSSSMGIQLQ